MYVMSLPRKCMCGHTPYSVTSSSTGQMPVTLKSPGVRRDVRRPREAGTRLQLELLLAFDDAHLAGAAVLAGCPR